MAGVAESDEHFTRNYEVSSSILDATHFANNVESVNIKLELNIYLLYC